MFVLSSCNMVSAPHEPALPVSEIENILIVHFDNGLMDAANYENMGAYEVEDIDGFMTEFSELKFGLPDPTAFMDLQQSCDAFVIAYRDGTVEVITYFAQVVLNVNDLENMNPEDINPSNLDLKFETKSCDKEAFCLLLERYSSNSVL